MGLLDSFFKPNPVKLLEKGDIEGVIKAFRHKDPKTRCLAAAALGGLGSGEGPLPREHFQDRAIDALAGALEDDDVRVRFFVAGNLAKIGAPKATGRLLCYKRKYCGNCAKALQSAADVPPLSRGFGFAEAVQRAAQVLSTAGRQCQCGATICAGCLPVGGGRLTCQLCGTTVW